MSKAETRENCGQDLPDSEWWGFCGFDNHVRQRAGGTDRRIRSEIEAQRIADGYKDE